MQVNRHNSPASSWRAAFYSTITLPILCTDILQARAVSMAFCAID